MILSTLSGISLRWKLSAAVGLLLLGVSGLQFYIGSVYVRRAAEHAASERMTGVIQLLEGALGQQTQSMKVRIRVTATLPAVTAAIADPTQAGAAFAAIRAVPPTDSALFAIELRNARGGRIASDHPVPTPLDSIAAALVTSGLGPDGSNVGPFTTMGDTVLISSAAAVTGTNGASGYIVEWRRVNNRASQTQAGALIGSNAALYIGSPGGGWTDQVHAAVPPPVDVSRLTSMTRYTRAGVGEVFASAARVGTTSWWIVLEFPVAVVLQPAQQFARTLLWVTAALLVISMLLASQFASRLTRPLTELTRVADGLGAGDHTVRMHPAGGGEVQRVADAVNRMIGRVEEESSARARSEEQWRRLFALNPLPMWVFEDGTLRFLEVNSAAVARYGWSRDEFLGLTLRDIRPPEDIPMLMEDLASQQEDNQRLRSWRHLSKDGKLMEVETISHPLMFDGRSARLVLSNDVGTRKTLEAQLRQAQKMEAVGRLAGGVAHDFNNVLAVITALTDLIRVDLGDAHRANGDLDTILRATQQGHGLTRQLLAFSRQQVLQPIGLDPNAVVAEAAQMLRRTIGEDIELTVAPITVKAEVRADPGQLQQVLLNVAFNARDAMPNGGRLTYAVTRAEVDEANRAIHGLAAAGDYVVIAVTDSGSGMTPEVRARIFEPFFTTKPLGKGTGLGLATAYGIVTQTGGNITVYSEVGRGTTVRIYLPITASTAAHPDTPADSRRRGGAEAIMLVEDDPLVRKATSEVLKRLGYSLHVADTPEHALEMLDEMEKPPELVISDVVMPRMDGPTLIARIRHRWPDQKALLMSGYTGEAILNRGLPADIAFIEKPFSVKKFAEQVRSILDGGV